MFPNKFLQMAAPLKFAKSTSVSTRALLAKFVLTFASKSKNRRVYIHLLCLLFCKSQDGKCHFLKWKSAATAALSAQKRNGRTLSMAAKPFILTIDGGWLFCYLSIF